MSSLSQFAPFAGGGLKSYQTGFVYVGQTVTGAQAGVEDGNYNDVSVSAVVVSKTITSFQGTASINPGGQYWLNYTTVLFPTTRLTSTTNLRIATSRYVGEPCYVTGRWQAAEAN